MTDKSHIEPVVNSSASEKLFDLRLLARLLWKWKWIIVIAAITGGAVGVRNATKFIPAYKAMMIVQPLDATSSSSQGIGSRMLGVARSIGIQAGQQSAPSFDLFRVMVGSLVVAQILQDKYGLLQKIYKSSWDSKNKIWIKPKVDENSFEQRLRRLFPLNPWHPPDISSLASYLKGAVKVEQIRETAFFKISVEHSEREFALNLLDIVYREVDAVIGLNRRQEQKERREYLKNQIEVARLAEVRDALLSLLMQQEQRAIIADASPPYTVKIIEPLNSPKHATEPLLYRTILLPAGIMIVLVIVIGTVIVSFRHE